MGFVYGGVGGATGAEGDALCATLFAGGLEMPQVTHCVLLCLLDVLEVMHCALFRLLEASKVLGVLDVPEVICHVLLCSPRC